MSMRTTQICPVLPALSGRLDNLNMSVRVRSGPFWIKYMLLISKFSSSTLSASDRRDVVGADNGWNGPPPKGGSIPATATRSAKNLLSGRIGWTGEMEIISSTPTVWVLPGHLRHRGNAHPVGFD